MKRCVIVAGAQINNYDFVRSYLSDDDYYIFCDSGLNHLEKLGVTPDLIVGDFDSYHEIPDFENLIKLPCEKDDTDSVFAVKEGLRLGFDDFLLIGMIGGRLDHSMGNISILLKLDSLGKSAMIVDDYSEIEIISNKPAFIDDSFSYFSLLAINGTSSDINSENTKYPLEHSTITCEYAYGVSNEVIPGKTAKIWLGSGSLLLIKVSGKIIPKN